MINFCYPDWIEQKGPNKLIAKIGKLISFA